MPPFASAEQLKQQLAPLAKEFPGAALVFDADGTLWSHDVGCMVFEAAYERGFLPEAARTALAAEASRVGVVTPSDASAKEIARHLEAAFLEGSYSTLEAAEMQVWAYVGCSIEELRAFCREVLDSEDHRQGLHEEVLEIAAWGREHGLVSKIVSASPRVVVEEAVRNLGFEPSDIAAGDPILSGGRIVPGMASPLPYGQDKVVAGMALLDNLPWLATFGDSSFDVQMMAEAKVPVGIGDKPSMLAGLSGLPGALRLQLSA